MQLTKINGNTYYIPAPTNIGVFQFKDKYTLLIDTGDNNQQARKISEIVQSNNLNIKYIVNTHNHIDHAGGNVFFQEHYPGSLFHASEDEKLFLENAYLFPMYLYGGSPVNELSRHFLKSKKLRIDEVMTAGTYKINDDKFEIIPLSGHARGQIGIGTRDRVCFLGDSLFSREIVAKYSFPFLFDIDKQLNSYKTIEELDYDYFVIGHASQIFSLTEIKDLVKFNRDNLNYYLDLALDLFTQPHTREEMLEEICILEELQLDFKEYYFSLSTIGAIIAYLHDQEELKYQIENGKLYYYK
ncbi:MAG: MBL fold metallo-hydrolase [Firmicutes bacterium HGW-Firmicutes-15]|nr:MAG: MBL fold metallo-hydrolase [Firmicutes bacterium HGW-Firmicutes-15]